jgi:hypothetical protein
MLQGLPSLSKSEARSSELWFGSCCTSTTFTSPSASSPSDRHQLVVSVGKFYTICRCILIQVYKLEELNSVLNSEIKIGHFVGHIHLNKFLIKLFFTKDKWVCVKLYSCLMVIVCTSKFISLVNFTKLIWGCSEVNLTNPKLFHLFKA